MRILCLMCLILTSNFSYADLIKKLDSMLAKSSIPKKHFGIYITKANKAIFHLNENKKFIPASLSKIITASTVLHKFPRDHRFITQLISETEIKDGTLKGALYLKGGGDPSFTSESLWQLVNEFIRNDIKKIEGPIIVDDTLFDQNYIGKNRDSIRVDRAYDAPIGAMSFNWNAVNVFARPAVKRGLAAKIFVDPQNDYFSVRNLSKTVRGSKVKLEVRRSKTKENKELITVRGSIGEAAKEKAFYRSVVQPAYWSGYQLKSFLKQRGVEVTQAIQTGKAPMNGKTYAEVKSRAIVPIVSDMMKFSNNFIAEMMTKNLAAISSVKSEVRSPATMKEGLKVIRSYLGELGLDPKNFNFVNASGLTRKNKFKPVDIHKVLNVMKNEFYLFSEFTSSLPISGVDGTLKSRIKSLKGIVRAKTGMLAGVIGLAGFMTNKNNELITFVFMFNGPNHKLYQAQAFIDRLTYVLHQDS